MLLKFFSSFISKSFNLIYSTSTSSIDALSVMAKQTLIITRNKKFEGNTVTRILLQSEFIYHKHKNIHKLLRELHIGRETK